jgi:hypothetical protein
VSVARLHSCAAPSWSVLVDGGSSVKARVGPGAAVPLAVVRRPEVEDHPAGNHGHTGARMVLFGRHGYDYAICEECGEYLCRLSMRHLSWVHVRSGFMGCES